MSHNKFKVGSATPNANGEITLNLTNLSDVSGTPSSDHYLKYDGSGWITASASAGSEIEYIFIGRGESNAYSNSPHGTGAFTASSDLYVYDSSPTNNITGATITSSSGWISSITLPTGNYLVSGQTLLEFSSSGYGAYAFHDSSNNVLSQVGVVGTSRGDYGGAGDLAYSVIELTSQTTIKLRLLAVGGTIDNGTNQGNTPSEHGLIVIEKLA
jgi:hypothetical protein